MRHILPPAYSGRVFGTSVSFSQKFPTLYIHTQNGQLGVSSMSCLDSKN